MNSNKLQPEIKTKNGKYCCICCKEIDNKLDYHLGKCSEDLNRILTACKINRLFQVMKIIGDNQTGESKCILSDFFIEK